MTVCRAICFHTLILAVMPCFLVLATELFLFFSSPGDEDDGAEQRGALVCLVPHHAAADVGDHGAAHRHAQGPGLAASLGRRHCVPCRRQMAEKVQCHCQVCATSAPVGVGIPSSSASGCVEEKENEGQTCDNDVDGDGVEITVIFRGN